MRMRLGMMIGFGAGYLMGAKAGRQRYDQLMATAARMWENPKVLEIREQASKAVDQASEIVTHKTLKLDDEDLPELLSPYEATINPPVGAKDHMP